MHDAGFSDSFERGRVCESWFHKHVGEPLFLTGQERHGRRRQASGEGVASRHRSDR